MEKILVFDLQGTLVDHGDPPCLFFQTVPCLLKLQQKYLMAVVTEGQVLENVENMLQDLGIRSFFQQILHLKGTPLQKKDGSAFRHLAELFGVLPSELIIVGDVPARDIAGGNRCKALTIRVRQGRHAAVEPTTTVEIPSVEIGHLGELPEVLAVLEKNKTLR